uniref:Uncharacterized protein n=1 Tax=Oryza punctata TaxID=4537 RepID=A0A0E0JM10_ORYPU
MGILSHGTDGRKCEIAIAPSSSAPLCSSFKLLNLELKGVKDMNHNEEVILVIVMVAVGLLVICLVLNFNWKCCKCGKNKHDDGHISISSTDDSARNAPNSGLKV